MLRLWMWRDGPAGDVLTCYTRKLQSQGPKPDGAIPGSISHLSGLYPNITCSEASPDALLSHHQSWAPQFSSVTQSCPTLCDPMNHSTCPGAGQASLSITNSQSPPKPMSIVSIMPSNHLILCHPLLLLPSIFPSIRVFSNESALRIRWPKYWSFSFKISPSNEHPGLISFRMDWLDLLAVQGILKSLLQHHSSKASILQCSAFFNSPTLTSIHDHWKNHSLD